MISYSLREVLLLTIVFTSLLSYTSAASVKKATPPYYYKYPPTHLHPMGEVHHGSPGCRIKLNKFDMSYARHAPDSLTDGEEHDDFKVITEHPDKDKIEKTALLKMFEDDTTEELEYSSQDTSTEAVSAAHNKNKLIHKVDYNEAGDNIEIAEGDSVHFDIKTNPKGKTEIDVKDNQGEQIIFDMNDNKADTIIINNKNNAKTRDEIEISRRTMVQIDDNSFKNGNEIYDVGESADGHYDIAKNKDQLVIINRRVNVDESTAEWDETTGGNLSSYGDFVFIDPQVTEPVTSIINHKDENETITIKNKEETGTDAKIKISISNDDDKLTITEKKSITTEKENNDDADNDKLTEDILLEIQKIQESVESDESKTTESNERRFLGVRDPNPFKFLFKLFHGKDYLTGISKETDGAGKA